jgi:AcrR family transcriptional regulator
MGGPQPPRLSDRRAAIARALDHCIRQHGYAETSLTDIAREAGMTPSHVLYYFPGKSAILEFHFDGLCAALLDDILPLEGKPPLEQIDALTDYWFGGETLDTAACGVYFEIFGVAVHSARIRSTKARWDGAMRRFLTALYAATPRGFGLSADRAAEAAFASLIGLRINRYFDQDRDLATSRELCRDTLRRLAGWNPSGATRS